MIKNSTSKQIKQQKIIINKKPDKQKQSTHKIYKKRNRNNITHKTRIATTENNRQTKYIKQQLKQK